MKGMDSKQLREFSDGLHELYTAPDVESLLRRALTLLTALVPGETAVFGERNSAGTAGPFRSDAFILHGANEFRKKEHAYREFIAQHPLDRQFQTTHDVRPMTFDEMMPQGQWERTELYNEFFVPLRLENVLCVAFECEHMPFVGIGVARAHEDFSPREYFLLDLLKPHMHSAYDLVQKFIHCRNAAKLRVEDETSQPLTPRETEVLHWVSQGKTNTE